MRLEAKMWGTALALLLLSASLFYFLPRNAAAIASTSNTSYAEDTFTPTNDSIDTTAGTIYQFNLSVVEKTYRWVGLWGNITGSIVLKGVGANDIFYQWSLSNGVTAGSMLYATTDPTGVDPTNFVGTNSTYLNQADTAYGYLTTVTDSITNTYDGAATFQSPSMQNSITVNSTTLQSSTWTNYFIKDVAGNIASTNDIVWAVQINPDQPAYNGELADYELLIPENEEVGDGEGVVTTYYLWVELN